MFATARDFASVFSIMRRDAPAAELTVLKIIPRGRVRAKSIKPTANTIAKRAQVLRCIGIPMNEKIDMRRCRRASCTCVGREGGQVLDYYTRDFFAINYRFAVPRQ